MVTQKRTPHQYQLFQGAGTLSKHEITTRTPIDSGHTIGPGTKIIRIKKILFSQAPGRHAPHVLHYSGLDRFMECAAEFACQPK